MTNAELLMTAAMVLSDLKVPGDWVLDASDGLNVQETALLPEGAEPGDWYGGEKDQRWQRTWEVEIRGIRVFAYELKPEADIDPDELPKPDEETEADATHEGRVLDGGRVLGVDDVDDQDVPF